eukprot:CAMPEP_0196732636 /NCGR_PEP_ID=MMETSP1091-20130531/11991_1 /TAXON_ID=302021 /ORGANISM="Rhodomonas sp., Strain CCMP768" /LENGTH=94 /DNA_ID=CAMNT_0042075937 /DNA_START=1 /DNA_END=281 /DNA_ORIENTATION=+
MHPLIDAEDKDRLARSGSIASNSDYIIANRMLILNFIRSAEPFISRPNGTIRVTAKDVYPYSWWRVQRLAQHARPIRLQTVEPFILETFPGYIS